MSYIGATPGYAAFVTDQFSGNGSTTAFTMSVTPAGATSLIVAVSGVLQDPTTYAVAGTTLTFSAAPPTGIGNISVRYLGLPASGVTNTAYRTVTEATATAGQTVFSIPSYTVGYLNVYQNGVLLGAADYTATTGTSVTLASGATVGDLITTESFYVSSVLNAIPNVGGSISATNLDIGNTNGTGSVAVPAGTTAQRPTGANGQFRYNSTTNSFEGYANGAWGAIGGGGGGAGAWQAVQTANFTAIAGNAYPVNTTSSAITVTLPASPAAGAYVQLTDYAGTWGTNNLTVNPNGAKIQSVTGNYVLTVNRESVALVYIDSTQGWVNYSGFVNNPVGPYTGTYLVVAGGGGSGGFGGGGAGGYLSGTTPLTPGSSYAVVIGAGGSGATNGNNSTGFGQTAVGGGWGGQAGSVGSGGSGGANAYKAGYGTAGSGTAGQGNNGSLGADGVVSYTSGGGGGGAGAAGTASTNQAGGAGGNGSLFTITGSYYAGGGTGGTNNSGAGVGPWAGGLGGGGIGYYNSAGGNGGTNTGGGAGGGTAASSGGSGVVIIAYTGSQRGTGGTVTSSGGYTIHTFTSSSTFTA